MTTITTTPDLEVIQEEITPTGIKVNHDPDILAACDQTSQEAALASDKKIDLENMELSTCYQLWLNLDTDRTRYEGKAKITYKNQTDNEQLDLVFRLYPNAERIYGGELEVNSTFGDGAEITPEVFLSDRTAVRLPLADPIKPGETAVIEMEFEGRLSDGLESEPVAYGIFNYSQENEVTTLANWYPLLAHWEDGDWRAEPVSGVGDAVVSEVSLYIVEVSVPEDIQVITSGIEINHSFGDEKDIYTYASGPMREFFIVSGNNFSPIQAEADGVLVKHWGLPGGEGRSSEALQATVDSLLIFADHFGPYPYRELDVVSVPLHLASGVEYPGILLMRDELYYVNEKQPYLLSTIMAHEVAHQWWYGLVGSDVLDHPWQDEALTTFSSLLYLEKTQPLVYSGTVGFFRQVSKDLGQDKAIGRATRSFINDPGKYSPIVYQHGSLFFVELREKLGDDDFFKALRSYFLKNIYQIAAPKDLLTEFSNACQCDLDKLFKQWGVK